MACGCDIYQCLEVDYNPCDNDIILPIVANETGDWVVLIEFNGTWIRLSISVTDGEPIAIQNVLNECYVHTIRLLNTEKELFNDTCYKAITKVVSPSQIPAINPNTPKETFALSFSTQDGVTEYQDARLIGSEILLLELEGIPQATPAYYTFDTLTGTITIVAPVMGGQQIYTQYKK